MPRRVLIIVENLPAPFDRRVWLEATTLAAAGYQVSVICPAMRGFTQRRETLQGVDIHRHPLPLEASGAAGYLLEYGAALFWQFALTLRIASTTGFDAIHACNPPDLIFLVAAPFKLFGKRFLFDQHDLCPELYEAKSGHRSGVFKALLRLAERATFGLADVVISTNQSYRRIALTRGRKRDDQVFVVRSGPDLAAWPRPRGRGDRKWRNGRAHLLGYVGVMGEQEGLDLLLQALADLVHARGVDVQLLLIGDGPQRPALETLAGALNLTHHVTFAGRLSDAELREGLLAADVCVNPDRPGALNDLSTMNKIVEYMAMGKPIVQFEATEGRYSAQDASLYARPGDTGDFADKVMTLLNDPVKRGQMGESGRRRVEQHLAWEHSAPLLLQAYDRLFAAPRR